MTTTTPRPHRSDRALGVIRRGRRWGLAGVGTAGAALLLTACGAATAAEDDPADTPSEEEIAALFDTWNEALATGDAETVANLYTEDATLLSTLSADIREGREEISGYFAEDFLPKQPQGVITESHVDVIDADSAYHAGLYDFTVVGEDGTETVVPARFTYVYELVDGTWLIDSHHSSVQP